MCSFRLLVSYSGADDTPTVLLVDCLQLEAILLEFLIISVGTIHDTPKLRKSAAPMMLTDMGQRYL
jgi:hypothetical protein